MKTYNQIDWISGYDSGGPYCDGPAENIPEGTVAEIVQNHPDANGYLYLKKDDGTVVCGPRIKRGKIWDASTGWVSPEYWMTNVESKTK